MQKGNDNLLLPRQGSCKYTFSSQISAWKMAARGIGHYINSDKTEFMSINENGVIFSSNSKLLKLVEQFSYLGSNISPTESDVNIHIGKAWSTIDRLSTIWNSDLTDQIKLEFF